MIHQVKIYLKYLHIFEGLDYHFEIPNERQQLNHQFERGMDVLE